MDITLGFSNGENNLVVSPPTFSKALNSAEPSFIKESHKEKRHMAVTHSACDAYHRVRQPQLPKECQGIYVRQRCLRSVKVYTYTNASHTLSLVKQTPKNVRTFNVCIRMPGMCVMLIHT
jgi:hypothetical protein